MEELELRMYFLVPYNILEIQKGIQAGHSMGEYALKYGRYNPQHVVWDFLEKWKTWIILNGGTTSFKIIEVGDEFKYAGTLNQFQKALEDNNVDHTTFIEPDINDALTAVCFIIDERVFNYEKYPDFKDYYFMEYGYNKGTEEFLNMKRTKQTESEYFNYDYPIWVETLGGEKNVFLRYLLKGKRLA